MPRDVARSAWRQLITSFLIRVIFFLLFSRGREHPRTRYISAKVETAKVDTLANSRLLERFVLSSKLPSTSNFEKRDSGRTGPTRFQSKTLMVFFCHYSLSFCAFILFYFPRRGGASFCEEMKNLWRNYKLWIFNKGERRWWRWSASHVFINFWFLSSAC